MNKLTKKKLLVISLGLLAVDLLLTLVIVAKDNSTYEHLNGQEIAPQSSELLRTVIFGQVVSVPIFGFLIGLIVAIFIDKNVSYSQRIVRSYLLTLSIMYGLFTVMGLFKVISFFLV